MEDKADLVRLAFRARALSIELEEMERLLNKVVAPGIRHAATSLQAIQAQLRELAGVQPIDVQAGVRAAEDRAWGVRDRTDWVDDEPEPLTGDSSPHQPI